MFVPQAPLSTVFLYMFWPTKPTFMSGAYSAFLTGETKNLLHMVEGKQKEDHDGQSSSDFYKAIA